VPDTSSPCVGLAAIRNKHSEHFGEDAFHCFFLIHECVCRGAEENISDAVKSVNAALISALSTNYQHIVQYLRGTDGRQVAEDLAADDFVPKEWRTAVANYRSSSAFRAPLTAIIQAHIFADLVDILADEETTITEEEFFKSSPLIESCVQTEPCYKQHSGTAVSLAERLLRDRFPSVQTMAASVMIEERVVAWRTRAWILAQQRKQSLGPRAGQTFPPLN
jgi:hypothetical protein